MTTAPPAPPPPALAGMASYPQWICWMLVQRPGKEKADKVPVDPRTRFPINAQDPAMWMTYADAVQWATQTRLGIGFVFTENDPYAFLDLDSCATPPGSSHPWQDHALQLIRRLPGAAVEISRSGRGLHVFGRCAPGLLHSSRCAQLNAELYTSKRFVALGYGAEGNCDTDITTGLTGIVEQYFPPHAAAGNGEWTDEARPGTGIPIDETLIRKALASKSANAAFGGRASFKDLWEGNEIALAMAYPDPQRAYDASRADAALAAHLAFWTGDNCEQIRRLMWESALRRDKWEREDYLPRTIMRAVGGEHEVYTGRESPRDPDAAPLPPPPPGTNAASVAVEPPEVTSIDGYPYVPADQMLELWRDYVYVIKVDRVLTPKGDFLSQSQFKAAFGRRAYPMDHTGTSNATKNAWKAYIDGECFDFLKAEYLRFLPQVNQRVVVINNDTYANAWSDPHPVRRPGDASIFVEHIRNLLPRGNDANILLAYMAACVQHQGTKFTWCPLIQGIQGNGKSTIAKVLEHAIGEKYVHVMKGGELFTQFNGWLGHSVLACIHDLKIGSGDQMEHIKPMITEPRQSIERKGIDQTTEHVSCNFILTTNHQNAIPLERAERRYAVFFCAQQRPGDLERQGMNGAYFRRLFKWLEEEGGYEIVADFLWTYDIPDALNPATHCKIAPETTSRESALEASLTPAAQFIMEAIEGEEPGFKGGWVSGHRAMTLLQGNGIKISPQGLGNLLRDLGYVRHPRLRGGKASRSISHEGARPRLYILEDHPTIHADRGEVVDSYERAQGYPQVKVVPFDRSDN